MLVRLCGCWVISGITVALETTSVATVEVTEPTTFVSTTVYPPALVVCTLFRVKIVLVWFVNAVPLYHHWYHGVGTPLAVTLKLAIIPDMFV